MRVQSETYDPFRPVRRVGIRAEIAIIDADAKPNASASSDTTESPSDPAQTIDENVQNPQTYATLERNAWILDGNHRMMDASASDLGWWSSSVSGDDGTFTETCGVVYDFTVDVKTVGLALHFIPGFHPAAGGMRILAYDADGALAADVTNTAGLPDEEVVFSAVYRRLEITFTMTALPGRRIRLTEIDFGLTQRFDDDTISEAEMRYKTDPVSASIPFGQCRLTVDNADRRWNLLNPQGIYQYLEEGQRISIWISVDGEDVYMGMFSFQSVEARDSALTAKITAADPIAALDDIEYNDGRCASAVFSDAIAEVLDGTEIECEFDNDIGDASVMMSVPKNTTRREAVRMLTQAVMGCVYADRTGILRFCRPPTELEAVTETVQIPIVTSDGYELYTSDGYQIVIEGEGDATPELTPNELYDYDGITISEPVGVVRLIVNDSYSDTEITYTAGESGKEITVKNPCVASENGDAVAAWLLKRYKRRKQYGVKNRCDPASELLDYVRIYDAYGQNDISMITGITISYNGGLSAETEAIG